jgi:hypothetical protein
VSATSTLPKEPYVGPRPFRRDELFYGREDDASGLVDTLTAGRIVLLHAPSGAGKTSLIQASVAPMMAELGFQICAQVAPFNAVRVTTPVADGVVAENRYVASAVTCLVGHLPDAGRPEGWTLTQALDRLAAEPGAPDLQLLVLDQFEEILITDPTDFEGQLGFFRQLGHALDNRRRWALLAMREDFMGGLDRFLRYIPGQLRTTYRLDLLDTDAALRAIQLPPRLFDVEFTDDAALRLIHKLQAMRAGVNDERLVRPGSYVEPVFLQVVCDGLWRTLRASRPRPLTTITVDDVKSFEPLEQALGTYYSTVVREAAGGSVRDQREIRDWVQNRLLTKDGLRSQTQAAPAVSDPAAVLALLQERYLIRGDQRDNVTWWELTHDRLGEQILEDNRAWRVKNLEPWQRAAYDWHRGHHDERYLLGANALRTARSKRRRTEEFTELERQFLERSEAAIAKASRLKRSQARFNFLAVLTAVSIALNVVLVVLLVLVLN